MNATDLRNAVLWQSGDQAALERLKHVVESARYKPGWAILLRFMDRDAEHLAGSSGWTLIVAASQEAGIPDSGTGEPASPQHWFAVPPTSWDIEGWQRYVLDCVLEVETHEAMEFLSFHGQKVFYPAHGPGTVSPYLIERKT